MSKVKRASKAAVICYGFGELASQLIWMFVGSYLTLFYTDIVGLAPIAVSTIMLVARVWDVVNDPMVGAIAERTRSRFGRFRPWFVFGCPFLALFGVLTFTNPFGGNSTASILWAAVTYIVTGMLFSLVNIPYGAMAAVMSEDANQRTEINSSRTIGTQLGMLVVNGATAALALKFSGEGAGVASGHGYMMTAVVYGVVAIPLFMIVFKTAKEVVQPKGKAVRFSFRNAVGNLVKNKYLMIVSFIMVLVMAAVMGRMSVVTFYVIYCLGSYKLLSLIMVIPSLCAILVSFIVPTLTKWLGKRNTLMFSNILMGIGLFIIYLAPYDNIVMILIGDVIYGMNMGFAISLTMVADSIDYMELKSGVRTEGTAYAIYGLATKIGNALGAAVGVMLLSAFGYVANEVQTVGALKGINIVTNLIPAILFFLSALVSLLWDMTDKEADDIRKKLRAKHVEEV